MDLRRLYHIFRIAMMNNGFKRAEYLKKNNIFKSQGNDCFWQPRNIPPEAKLIELGDNVVIASEVLFINHDVIHHVLNELTKEDEYNFKILYGSIKISNNVFIGSRSTILPNTRIDSNCVVGAGSLVKGHLKSNGIYAGVPAKRIGEFSTLLEERKEMVINNLPTNSFDYAWKYFNKKYN